MSIMDVERRRCSTAAKRAQPCICIRFLSTLLMPTSLTDEEGERERDGE